MKRFFRQLQQQTRKRPFFSALVIIMIMVVPGYLRLENAVNTANDTTKQVAVVTASQAEQVKQTSLVNCQTRNTAQKNGRDRFSQLFNAIEVIFTSNPATTPEQQQAAHAFVESLRKAVPLDPSVEDVDCNKDGQLSLSDYG